MTRISFTIPGEPQGKDRPRADARVIDTEDGPVAAVRLRTTQKTVAAERAVLAAFRRAHPGHKPWTGAVLVRFTAVFATPASFNKALKAAAQSGGLYCIKKPDKDNIEKLIVDALTPPKRRPRDLVAPSADGFAWVDDAQVMGGGIKRYGSPARIDVTLELLETPDSVVTPGERRTKARVAAGNTGSAVSAPRANPTKSKKRSPRLQAAIDAALARETGKLL